MYDLNGDGQEVDNWAKVRPPHPTPLTPHPTPIYGHACRVNLRHAWPFVQSQGTAPNPQPLFLAMIRAQGPIPSPETPFLAIFTGPRSNPKRLLFLHYSQSCT